MAFYDGNNNGFYMPVAPAYGGYPVASNYGGGMGGMFGGDGAWWLLLLVLLGGGMWGGFGGFGMGGMMGAGMWGMDMLYPWLNNSQHISDGFRDQMLQTTVNSIGDKITTGFGNVSTQLCSGFAGVTAAVTGAQNAIAQQLYTNQIADMERSYAAQTAAAQGFTGLQGQLAQCCCDNRLANCQTNNTIISEAAATRAAGTADTQKILDKLCQLEQDTLRTQLAAEQRDNANLRTELMYARGQASQVEQTAQLRANQATVANQLVSELRSCPIPAQPVYGNQPIFQCPVNLGNSNGFGCGCAA